MAKNQVANEAEEIKDSNVVDLAELEKMTNTLEDEFAPDPDDQDEEIVDDGTVIDDDDETDDDDSNSDETDGQDGNSGDGTDDGKDTDDSDSDKLAGIYSSVSELEKGYKNLLGEYTRVAQVLQERNNPKGDSDDKNDDDDDKQFDPFNPEQIASVVEKVIDKRLGERDKAENAKSAATQMYEKFTADYPKADPQKVYEYAMQNGFPSLESAYVMMLKDSNNLSALTGGKTQDEGDKKPESKPEEKKASPSMNRMGGSANNDPSEGNRKQYTPMEVAQNPKLLDDMSPKDRMAFLRKYS